MRCKQHKYVYTSKNCWLTVLSSSSLASNSFWTMSTYANNTLTIVLASLFMYRLDISGSGHSNFDITPKHCVSWVNTSTTELENNACSELLWNYNYKIKFKKLSDQSLRRRCLLTPSFLSLLKAPCKYSKDTSSFSLSHCITNGSNQDGYSGIASLYGGASFT